MIVPHSFFCLLLSTLVFGEQTEKAAEKVTEKVTEKATEKATTNLQFSLKATTSNEDKSYESFRYIRRLLRVNRNIEERVLAIKQYFNEEPKFKDLAGPKAEATAYAKTIAKSLINSPVFDNYRSPAKYGEIKSAYESLIKAYKVEFDLPKKDDFIQSFFKKNSFSDDDLLQFGVWELGFLLSMKDTEYEKEKDKNGNEEFLYMAYYGFECSTCEDRIKQENPFKSSKEGNCDELKLDDSLVKIERPEGLFVDICFTDEKDSKYKVYYDTKLKMPIYSIYNHRYGMEVKDSTNEMSFPISGIKNPSFDGLEASNEKEILSYDTMQLSSVGNFDLQKAVVNVFPFNFRFVKQKRTDSWNFVESAFKDFIDYYLPSDKISQGANILTGVSMSVLRIKGQKVYITSNVLERILHESDEKDAKKEEEGSKSKDEKNGKTSESKDNDGENGKVSESGNERDGKKSDGKDFKKEEMVSKVKDEVEGKGKGSDSEEKKEKVKSSDEKGKDKVSDANDDKDSSSQADAKKESEGDNEKDSDATEGSKSEKNVDAKESENLFDAIAVPKRAWKVVMLKKGKKTFAFGVSCLTFAGNKLPCRFDSLKTIGRMSNLKFGDNIIDDHCKFLDEFGTSCGDSRDKWFGNYIGKHTNYFPALSCAKKGGRYLDTISGSYGCFVDDVNSIHPVLAFLKNLNIDLGVKPKQQYLFALKDYIAQGKDGSYFHGQYKSKKVVVKVLDPLDDDLDETKTADAFTKIIEKEVVPLAKMKLLKGKPYFPEKGPPMFAIKFINGTSLEEVLSDPINTLSRESLIKGAFEQLKKLHKAGFLHNNPNLRNFKVTSKGQVFLINFGRCTELTDKDDDKKDFIFLTSMIKSLFGQKSNGEKFEDMEAFKEYKLRVPDKNKKKNDFEKFIKILNEKDCEFSLPENVEAKTWKEIRDTKEEEVKDIDSEKSLAKVIKEIKDHRKQILKPTKLITTKIEAVVNYKVKTLLFPAKVDAKQTAKKSTVNGYTYETVTTIDNVKLQVGFLKKNSHDTVILFHGIDGGLESMTAFADWYNKNTKVNIVLISCRGFGENEPDNLQNEKGLVFDTIAAVEYAVKKVPKVDIEKHFTAHGYSRGSANAAIAGRLFKMKMVIDRGFTSGFERVVEGITKDLKSFSDVSARYFASKVVRAGESIVIPKSPLLQTHEYITSGLDVLKLVQAFPSRVFVIGSKNDKELGVHFKKFKEIKESFEEASKESSEESSKKSAEKSGKSIKKSAEESSKKSAEESSKKSAEKSEKSIKKSAEESSKKSAEESTKKSPKKITKESTEEDSIKTSSKEVFDCQCGHSETIFLSSSDLSSELANLVSFVTSEEKKTILEKAIDFGKDTCNVLKGMFSSPNK